MAQYGDEYGHVENQEHDSQAVHEISDGNMADRGIVTHEGKNGVSSGDNLLQQQPQQENYDRSGNEGEGGARNKKGLTEKIVEKIPGVGDKQQQSHDTNNIVDRTTPLDATTKPGEGNVVEKTKEMMGKIKEKIPGVGPKEQQFHKTNNTIDESTIIDTRAMPGGECEFGEKKQEIMEEIKEKIPRADSTKHQSYGTTTTMTGDEDKHGDENKGLIAKIKEKLPGHN